MHLGAGRHAQYFGLGREPLLKKRGGLSAFDAAPHCVHDAAFCRPIASVKGQPIWQMNLNGHALDSHFQRPQLEKALLEKHSQNFRSKEIFRGIRMQTWNELIPRFDRDKFLVRGNPRKLEKIEFTMHRV
jgi:hypothetical protein